MNSWIFFKVGRVNPDVRVPVEFQEYDTFHFRLLSSFFPVLQPFLAQGEHAKSSNGVVVLAKPIVPRENQAGIMTAPISLGECGMPLPLLHQNRFRNYSNKYITVSKSNK